MIVPGVSTTSRCGGFLRDLEEYSPSPIEFENSPPRWATSYGNSAWATKGEKRTKTIDRVRSYVCMYGSLRKLLIGQIPNGNGPFRLLLNLDFHVATNLHAAEIFRLRFSLVSTFSTPFPVAALSSFSHPPQRTFYWFQSLLCTGRWFCCRQSVGKTPHGDHDTGTTITTTAIIPYMIRPTFQHRTPKNKAAKRQRLQ